MRIVRSGLTVGLVVSFFAIAGVASGADGDPVAEEVEVYVQQIDRSGKAKGPKLKLTAEEAAAHRVRGSDRQAGEETSAAAVVRRTASLRRISGSGCQAVSVARVGRSLLGFVTYKFWQQKNWCWTYPRVTGALSQAWVTDVDPNYRFNGIISSWGDFYSWCCGVWNSGHQSFRQGAFQNCILTFGCVRTEYPWVIIRGHSDGGFSYDTGT